MDAAKCHEKKTLEELKDVAEHQYVSVTGIVNSLFSIEKITVKSTGKELRKRDFLLADTTAVYMYRCAAWEAHIELLRRTKLRSFNGEKYLSIGQHCKVATIEDIGQAINDENPQGNSGQAKVIKAEIVTVVTIDTYKSCRNCNTKIPDSNTALAVCHKCNAKMKLVKCANHSVANVILEDVENKVYRVAIFNKVLELIRKYTKEAVGECDFADQLLSAPPLNYMITHKDVVSSVSHCD